MAAQLNAKHSVMPGLRSQDFVAPWVGEAEYGHKARAVGEDGDAGDTGEGDGEDGNPEGAIGSVAVAVVGGRGRLAVSEGRDISQSPGDPTTCAR